MVRCGCQHQELQDQHVKSRRLRRRACQMQWWLTVDSQKYLKMLILIYHISADTQNFRRFTQSKCSSEKAKDGRRNALELGNLRAACILRRLLRR